MTPERTMLLALSMDAQPVSALAVKAGLAHDDAVVALQRLQHEHLAIADDGGYELTVSVLQFRRPQRDPDD